MSAHALLDVRRLIGLIHHCVVPRRLASMALFIGVSWVHSSRKGAAPYGGSVTIICSCPPQVDGIPRFAVELDLVDFHHDFRDCIFFLL